MQKNKLKGAMAEKRVTLRKLSELTGIPYGTLRNKADGITRFYVDEAEIISNVLGILNEPERVQEIFFS